MQDDGRLSEIRKQSLYIKEKPYPLSKALNGGHCIFYEPSGVENLTLPQDDRKTRVFLHAILRALCGQG